MANIYVYSEAPNRGARSLAQALGATRLRKFDGMDFWMKKQRIEVNPNDVIICWGKPLPQLDGVRMLNYGKPLTQSEEMWALMNSGIPTINISSKYQPSFIPRS